MRYLNETAGQFDSKSLDLALLALNELARRKSEEPVSYDKTDIKNFCDSLIAENDEMQVEIIDRLVEQGISR